MTYLITQILLCLLIAFLLGLLLGYLLGKMCNRKTSCDKQHYEDDHDDDASASATVAGSDASTAQGFVSSYVEEEVAETAMIALDTNVDLDADAYLIETLEGIGPQTGNLFRGYGIASVGDYLRKLHKPMAREQAAKDLNILVKPVHDWASMADLLRVEGIDHQYAELAYATGVATVGQLASCNSDELVAEMDAVNNAGKQAIAPTVPSADEVQDWIARARGMSPVITI